MDAQAAFFEVDVLPTQSAQFGFPREMKAMVDHDATNAWQEAFDHLARMIDASEPGLAN
ncbi:hypothetical protein [Aureimonas sp. OT7]|uniref:hypothetical protein n=1 Tax=Aureimonas sp. OT7 TaxID=2816454 RepID=UPI001FEF7EDE|nr:hypothetical protein [Aureimonas sp. OT7]